jgi:hypothetical protein
MDLSQFEAQLRSALSGYSYIQNIYIFRRTPISLKGIIVLDEKYEIIVFYNSTFSIISFSLIFEKNRVFGIDTDSRIGWHIHPEENPNSHKSVSEKSIAEIIAIIDKIYCKRLGF